MFVECEYEDLLELSEEELSLIEAEVDTLISVWQVKNLRAELMLFHDDQHIGEPRRQLMAVEHPKFDLEALRIFESTPVVDNLEGNMLIHPCTTPVIEIDKERKVARGLWWSFGMEALSKYREKPLAMISLGILPTIAIRNEDGEWRLFLRGWQRTTKTDLHKGWVEDMQPTNCRPPLTKEQDLKGAGKYAYFKDRVRKHVPIPPMPDTFEKFPGDISEEWLHWGLEKREESWSALSTPQQHEKNA